MKILITGWYVLRSIVLRGPVNSCLMMKDEMRYERLFGIGTALFKKSDSPNYFHYQGASYRVLFRIFSLLPEYTRKFHFFDIGCGTGRAIFVAEKCGFTYCSGVELDKSLVELAFQNEQVNKVKRPGSVFRFVHGNALEYNYRSEKTVYFLFNPFSEDILRRVLQKIIACTREETWFVYMNPRFPAPFKELSIPLVQKVKTNLYTEAFIFCLNAR